MPSAAALLGVVEQVVVDTSDLGCLRLARPVDCVDVACAMELPAFCSKATICIQY